MKMVKDKQILVAADFGGFELKEAVVKHLKERGWTVTDVGWKAGEYGRAGDVPAHRPQSRGHGGGGEFDVPCCSVEPGWGSISRPANALMYTARSLKPSLPPCGA